MSAPRAASPTVRRRALASTLRRLRNEAGLTLEDAANALEVSVPTVSRYETGVRIPRARDVRELCRLYGVGDDEAAQVAVLVSGAKESGWWDAYSELEGEGDYWTFVGLESAATQLDEYAGNVIPGLLQTPEYARALYRQVVSPSFDEPMRDEDVTRLVEIRLERQRRLTSLRGPRFTTVINEAVLMRPVGGPDVMREQLRYLATAAKTGTTFIRVLPLSIGAHPGAAGSFVILYLSQMGVPDVVHLESLAGSAFLDSEDVVRRYKRVYEVLSDMALSPEQSAARLQELVIES